MMIKNLCFFLLCSLILSSCARLDDNLFNPSTLTEYKRDAYTGEVDFKLDASFDISAANIYEFTLTSVADGEAATIYAVYIGDRTLINTHKVILYAHGNKDHMDFYWPRAKLLANIASDIGVLMIDYRGYGRSTGEPSEEGLYADVDAAMQWLQSEGLTDDRLILYGFSMGTAPATELTANTRSMIPAKLILEAPFASAEVMAQDATLLALPGSYVTNLKIDNAAEIQKVQQPLLWLHGTADDFLNIHTHGEVVYKNHLGSEGVGKFPRRIIGAGHSDLPEVMGGTDNFQLYLQIVRDFINGVL